MLLEIVGRVSPKGAHPTGWPRVSSQLFLHGSLRPGAQSVIAIRLQLKGKLTIHLASVAVGQRGCSALRWTHKRQILANDPDVKSGGGDT